MKSLTQFLKEHESDEVDAMVDILTMGYLYTDTKSTKFVDALYKEAEKLYLKNESSRIYFFFVNKSKLNKHTEQSLKMCCKYGTPSYPYYDVRFKWETNHDTKDDNIKDVISELWKELDLDKEQVYNDKFGTIYRWKTGIYVDSQYGQICLYTTKQ